MTRFSRMIFAACLLASTGSCAKHAPEVARVKLSDDASATGQKPVTVRCAVIGGLADTGLWQGLSERFRTETGHPVEIVSQGPKQEVIGDFVQGRAHLIAMHASDTMINLVADGLSDSAVPWARNDFVLVGPEDDPAGIKGMPDVAAAVGQIIDKKCKLLVHSSHGAMEVLRDVMDPAGLAFDPENTIVRIDDKHRQMLLFAAEQKAYTLVGRIPFLNGKIPKQNLAIMVQGDPRLRRPYLVAVSNPSRHDPSEVAAARQLVGFLRSETTQRWIAEYGRGQLDDEPLFFRVELPAAP